MKGHIVQLEIRCLLKTRKTPKDTQDRGRGCLCQENCVCLVQLTNWFIMSWIFPPAVTDYLCVRGGQNIANIVCKVAWRAAGWVPLC